MKEAIAFHLEGLAEDGDPLPDGTGPGVYVPWRPPAAA
jgi:predicted RNase H-like HicB family nuclease